MIGASLLPEAAARLSGLGRGRWVALVFVGCCAPMSCEYGGAILFLAA